MTTVPIDQQRRLRNTAEVIQLVVDDLIPTDTAVECLRTAGLATHLSDTQVAELVNNAAEATLWRDRLRTDVMALWLLYEDEDLARVRNREELNGLADERAIGFDVEAQQAIATLAALPDVAVAS